MLNHIRVKLRILTIQTLEKATLLLWLSLGTVKKL
jgi:hypothetical protein